MLTADFHQRHSSGTVDRAATLLADVKAPAREWADDGEGTVSGVACITCGCWMATVGDQCEACSS